MLKSVAWNAPGKQALPISSQTTARSNNSAPIPPYSSGIRSPVQPWSAIARHNSSSFAVSVVISSRTRFDLQLRLKNSRAESFNNFCGLLRSNSMTLFSVTLFSNSWAVQARVPQWCFVESHWCLLRSYCHAISGSCIATCRDRNQRVGRTLQRSPVRFAGFAGSIHSSRVFGSSLRDQVCRSYSTTLRRDLYSSAESPVRDKPGRAFAEPADLHLRVSHFLETSAHAWSAPRDCAWRAPGYRCRGLPVRSSTP